jgi:peptidoglycan/LPS O-acetylase OafA/YrhL
VVGSLVAMNDRLRLGAIGGFFSRISYSLYLNHGGLGLLLITVLEPHVRYAAALVVAVVAVVLISSASFRFVELPAQRIARQLTRRRATAAAPRVEATTG